ncbi:hypothetical protein [Streptomyces rubiginosohelvolus]|uniref:hypothetical protein n=1 Tax=Streptomyces rubiginosohelvolus TaxID=67362 RepID=UPI003F4D4EA6
MKRALAELGYVSVPEELLESDYEGPIAPECFEGDLRHLTLALPPRHAARLLDAQAAGVDEDQLLQLAAEALGETYFRDNGRRAHGLEVELTDLLDLQFRL